MSGANLNTAGNIQKKSTYHHGNLRNAIIEAVAYLISKSRSLDFQLKDVAELVGTSPPSIYRHFESKQHLLVESAIVGYELQEEYRSRAIQQADPSPLAKLLAVGFAYIHFAQVHPGFFLLMKTLETEEILSSRRYQAARLRTLRLVRELVEECADAGLIEAIDTDLAMASLQATAFGLASLYLSDQLRYVASSLLDDNHLPERVFAVNLGSLLSEQGRRQIDLVNKNPFTRT